MKIVSSPVGNELHVVFLSNSGTLRHCICHENGAWDAWETLHPAGDFKDVSCAGVGATLHVLGITDDGLCMHRMREKHGEWTEFARLEHQPLFEH